MNNKQFEYQLEDFTLPVIDLSSVYSIYYVLDGMEAVLNRKELAFIKSCERLHDEIKEYKHFISVKLAQAIRDYTIIVCFTESRYAFRKIIENPFVVINKLAMEYKNIENRSVFNSFRTRVYDYSVWSIVFSCKHIFDDYRWEESYGGILWGFITDLIYKYDKMTPEEYVDYCVDVHHNSGVYLNKGVNIFSVNVDTLRCLLTDKRYDELWTLIETYTENLDYKTLKFIERFYNLMQVYKTFLPTFIKDQVQDEARVRVLLKEYLKNKSSTYKGNKAIYFLERYKPKIFGKKDYSEEFEAYYWYRDNEGSHKEYFPFWQKNKYFNVALSKYCQH